MKKESKEEQKVQRRETPWKLNELERNQKLCMSSALKLRKLRKDSHSNITLE